jgi:hypothetical protein
MQAKNKKCRFLDIGFSKNADFWTLDFQKMHIFGH